MAEAPTITNFAEFEAAGGKIYQQEPEPAKPKPAEPAEETPEAEPAEPEPAAEPEKKPKGKPKLTLSQEHARLLKEVTELRRERRELQQPRPQTQTAAPPADGDKPPTRPRLSTFPGTLEEYEAEVEKYELAQREYIEKQWERKQQEQSAKTEQQKVAQAYGEKLADHMKQHPNYDEEIGQTPLSPLMVDLVLQEGPALGQALIDDKEEAQRIANLAPGYQILEMGKLIGRLNGHGKAQTEAEEPEPERERTVKVPAKLSATGGSTVGSASKPGYGARNFAEYEKLAAKYEQRRAGFSTRK